MRFLVAGDAIYGSKHLGGFLRTAFAEEVAREAERQERFATLDRPEDMEVSQVVTAYGPRPDLAASSGAVPNPGEPGAEPEPSFVGVPPEEEEYEDVTGPQESDLTAAIVAPDLSDRTMITAPPSGSGDHAGARGGGAVPGDGDQGGSAHAQQSWASPVREQLGSPPFAAAAPRIPRASSAHRQLRDPAHREQLRDPAHREQLRDPAHADPGPGAGRHRCGAEVRRRDLCGARSLHDRPGAEPGRGSPCGGRGGGGRSPDPPDGATAVRGADGLRGPR